MRAISPVILVGFSMLIIGDSSSEIIHKITTKIDNNSLANANLIYIPSKQDYDPVIHQYVDNIYQFMLADLAEQRKEPIIAKNNLLDLLAKTKDLRIAQILTEFALGADDYLLATMAAQEWATLAANDPAPQLIAVILLLNQNVATENIEKFLAQAMKTNPKIDTQIYDILPELNNTQKELLEQNILALIIKDPKDPVKYLCLANTQVHLNKIEAATKSLTNALILKPSLTNAIILQAKLIKNNTKSDKLALAYLDEQIQKFSKNEELHIFYANALFDSNQNTHALKILNSINNSKNTTYQLEADLLRAEIYMQPPTINYNKAKKYLYKLLNNNLANDKAYFLLAQIAEKQSDFTLAIRFYTLIEDKPYHLISFLRAALLLAENEQLNLAIDTLEQARPETILEQKQVVLLKTQFLIESQDFDNAANYINEWIHLIEDDTDFLYASSVINSLCNKIDAAEQDLKKIIRLEPENHVALNALGFILINNNSRHHEALKYLQKALNLSPENPLYMDNLGILLYKMGKIKDSLAILSVAYQISDSINIATHLGEVLWSAGEKLQAKVIWQKAWKKDPNDLELVNILNHYQILFTKSN